MLNIVSSEFFLTSGSGLHRSWIRVGRPLLSKIWTLQTKSTDREARHSVANSWTTTSSWRRERKLCRLLVLLPRIHSKYILLGLCISWSKWLTLKWQFIDDWWNDINFFQSTLYIAFQWKHETALTTTHHSVWKSTKLQSLGCIVRHQMTEKASLHWFPMLSDSLLAVMMPKAMRALRLTSLLSWLMSWQRGSNAPSPSSETLFSSPNNRGRQWTGKLSVVPNRPECMWAFIVYLWSREDKHCSEIKHKRKRLDIDSFIIQWLLILNNILNM